MSEDQINVLACANRAYMQHLGVMLTSLLSNNPGRPFHIVVVTGNGADGEGEKLRATLARFPGARLSMRGFKPDPTLDLPTPASYTADIYTRLWVQDFFGPEVDRVLYLDCDMVVVGDIGALWSEDLGGKLLGAVDIPGATRPAELGMPQGYGYFNSGLLLFDLARWRGDGALQRVLDLIRARGPSFADPDQDALNLCFYADRRALDYKWNVTTPFYKPSHDLRLSPAEVEAVQREARIIHFNGISRPWSYHSRHPRKPDYYRYLEQTEWRGFQPSDRTPFDMARKHIGPLLPKPAKRWLRPLLGMGEG